MQTAEQLAVALITSGKGALVKLENGAKRAVKVSDLVLYVTVGKQYEDGRPVHRETGFEFLYDCELVKFTESNSEEYKEWSLNA